MQLEYSIIITSYNRAWCIDRALSSAHQFLLMADCRAEIIIVDDGSTDCTVTKIKQYMDSCSDNVLKLIKLISLPGNRGVCGAKNIGVSTARGTWVLFLDSDDELIPESYNILSDVIEKHSEHPVHFFGTVPPVNVQFKHPNVVKYIDINSLVINGTGGRDAVPVVRGDIIRKFSYDEDIRGYEGLVYLRLAAFYGKLVLHSIPIIIVHTDHLDRLSSDSGRKARYNDIASGHKRVLKEHWKVLDLRSKTKMILRYINSFASKMIYTFMNVRNEK